MAQPGPKLILQGRVFGLLDTTPHQGREGGVLVENLGVRQTFLPPLREFAYLQIGDGGKIVLCLQSATVLLAAVQEPADRDDGRGQANENQTKSAGYIGLSSFISLWTPLGYPLNGLSSMLSRSYADFQ